tara:strand:+ start:1212 stop:2606 length:1395 start_codon:yes stop_codon:yes gene_type:complete
MTSTIKVNKIEKVDGSTIELGGPGTSVNLASGATQTGFGRTGTVNWQTGSIKTGDFTAANGEGYFVNTTSSAVTMTLPASPSAGDIVAVKDYLMTFATNNLTIARNGEPINGGSVTDIEISTNGASVMLVYVDGTQGWLATLDDSSTLKGETFIVASGGTETVSGNFKMHTFTSSGTFTVSSLSGNPPSNAIDYLVVAGGGGGGGSGSAGGSGGGAGGFRVSNSLSIPAPTMSPLANPTGLTATVASFPITIGAGGTGGCGLFPPGNQGGTQGGTSTFSTISSAGGGRGGGYFCSTGGNGGSGAGGGDPDGPGPNDGGTGNTPPVSPPQGNNGGNGTGPGGNDSTQAAGGGGGAGAAGTAGAFCGVGGNGGVGSFISPSFGGANGTTGPTPNVRFFAGGGGGRATVSRGTGGAGGGGDAQNGTGTAGTANTGGGGGGAGVGGSPACGLGGAGGSGIVIIRYKFQ